MQPKYVAPGARPETMRLHLAQMTQHVGVTIKEVNVLGGNLLSMNAVMRGMGVAIQRGANSFAE